MFTEYVLIAALAKEQIEPKHSDPIPRKSTDTPLEHTHEEDFGREWPSIAVQPIVAVASIVVQVRNLFSDEVAWIRLGGPQRVRSAHTENLQGTGNTNKEFSLISPAG